MTGVVLATDGSEYADHAADHAVALARERDVPLHVLCVVDRREFGETALSSGQLAAIRAEDHGHDCVTDVAATARARGLDVETRVCHGVPEEEILAYADRVGADTLVLGEHGDRTVHLGGVGRKLRAESRLETRVVPAA